MVNGTGLLPGLKWDIASLRELSGEEFEVALALMFLMMGYSVQLTPSRNDQGADLVVVNRAGKRIAVQAKNTRNPVGNGAIQEVLGGMDFYGCEAGIVVATSEFTESARQLAASQGRVQLWDAEKLQAVLVRHAEPEPKKQERLPNTMCTIAQDQNGNPITLGFSTTHGFGVEVEGETIFYDARMWRLLAILAPLVAQAIAERYAWSSETSDHD